MTNILKKIILSQKSYKLFIILYSFSLAFTTQALSFSLDDSRAIFNPILALVEFNREVEADEVVTAVDPRIKQIEDYYGRYDLPLGEYAEAFVTSADKYGIDYRLVAAIGFIESTGGKFACQTATYSAFGWGSCNINFDSYEQSIDVISMNLGGHNPNTAQYYEGKTIREILWSYNPDTIRAGYGDMVINQMEIIASM
jgi:hypothetical protein